MAKKNNARSDTAASTSEPVSRTATPILNEQRPSTSQTNGTQDSQMIQKNISNTAAHNDASTAQKTDSARPSIESSDPTAFSSRSLETAQRPSKDSLRASRDIQFTDNVADEDGAVLLQAQLEHEEVKSRMQEEIQGYIERIDALNTKLQYLAKEAAQSAKDAASEAEHGSIEKKISEKDERIALLLEEGQKLSVTEMKNLAIIKRLRTQIATNSKDQDAIRKRAEKAEQQVATSSDKLRKAEQSARKAELQAAALSKTSQDLETLTRERKGFNETIENLKVEIAKANTRAENAETQVQSSQLEAETKRAAELQDDLTSAKIERELAEEKFKREIKELQAALEKEKEQSRSMESEMLAEQAVLESRLESFRVRAEEATSNDQGNTQAKLLRQIETLQSQYATASQNWQGIEGTLLAKITDLEKDRDEIAARETDVRKKLRDVTLKAKNNGIELEEAQIRLATLQEGQSDIQAENQRLTRKHKQFDDEIERLQKESEQQRLRMEREFARKLDEEKTKWAMSIQRVRTESPGISVRKSSGYDIEHLMSPTLIERPYGRRSSTLPSAPHEAPPRQHSVSSVKGVSNGMVPETPSIMTTNDDDYFTGVPATPVSQSQHASRRGFNDVLSTSTVGAGPSVQLIERMSANVRRLESEKAASKDELTRLSTQRDESRQEVVRLMRDLEQKSKVEARLKEIEAEHSELSKRYQTTLELLGEKSEQVDELKQDIADVKQMYRDLADHMK